jgi:hypothetical protein
VAVAITGVHTHMALYLVGVLLSAILGQYAVDSQHVNDSNVFIDTDW